MTTAVRCILEITNGRKQMIQSGGLGSNGDISGCNNDNNGDIVLIIPPVCPRL